MLEKSKLRSVGEWAFQHQLLTPFEAFIIGGGAAALFAGHIGAALLWVLLGAAGIIGANWLLNK